MAETQVVVGSADPAEALEAQRRAPLDELAEQAGLLLLVGLALGALGQLLFYGVGLGINYPLAIAALLGAAWMMRRDRPAILDLWLAPAALVFAAFTAIRADPRMVALDILASLTLASWALASFAGRAVARRSFAGLVGLLARAATWVAGGAAGVARVAARTLETPAILRRTASSVAPVLRGVAIAIPVVFVFVVLFSSADAVFASYVERVFDVRLNLGDLVGRVLLGLLLAWAATGALALATARPLDEPIRATVEHGPRSSRGATEAMVVLATVDVVFAAFVILQAAYLFGGLDTLSAAGLTYSEYARRGFFELVAVVVFSGALILAVERTVGLRARPRLLAACLLTALTSAVLISAGMRLRLYQEAYGWTEFRLYVLAIIVVFGIGLAGLLAGLVTDRVRRLGHVLLGATLAVGLALNLLGPVRFITEQNVARVLDPALVPPNGSTGLDESYVLSLGDDAVPELLRALPALPEGETTSIRTALAERLQVLEQDAGLNAWQAWNAGRASARDALERANAAGDLR